MCLAKCAFIYDVWVLEVLLCSDILPRVTCAKLLPQKLWLRAIWSLSGRVVARLPELLRERVLPTSSFQSILMERQTYASYTCDRVKVGQSSLRSSFVFRRASTSFTKANSAHHLTPIALLFIVCLERSSGTPDIRITLHHFISWLHCLIYLYSLEWCYASEARYCM